MAAGLLTSMSDATGSAGTPDHGHVDVRAVTITLTSAIFRDHGSRQAEQRDRDHGLRSCDRAVTITLRAADV